MDLQRLFDRALAAPLIRFGDRRMVPVTLRDGRTFIAEALYEPKHEEVFAENGIEVLRPWPRVMFRRGQLVSAGATDPQKQMTGASIVIDGVSMSLEQVRDDGFSFVAARVSSIGGESGNEIIPDLL